MTTDRRVIAVTGNEARELLQDLVTNDVNRVSEGLVYCALLTPQGKYLADFFLFERDGTLMLDVAEPMAGDLLQRLRMYKLRRDVAFEETDLKVRRGTGEAPEGALVDPRHPAMGWRLYGAEGGDDGTDFDAIRVEHCIPEAGTELIANDTFILEAGFDRLHGVDFRKGCYVGQEVTARMKHKTELRKGFATVEVEGEAPVGTDITAGGKAAGTLYTQAGGRGIAYLRFDRATGDMQAGEARVAFNGAG
ncbi:CAF17-like 4Fe-4S cluster assembly/insertion protein YgfZ [Tranquillimonas alkanivorans]|uniref:CAF17 C-terminal domain-containing protein n=1 Tax=Tranquillimonas alkanivorans TaxID=441119 RepID=A0A1I5MB63_9RHOB|nr:folate-binding protein YgfZ [Tranquillimonas alkanivorans]SFP06878.1 hypothetical protein SAMN04488047_102191 [Tranquillimonas alkanivorans]